jgi:hypothetical protein
MERWGSFNNKIEPASMPAFFICRPLTGRVESGVSRLPGLAHAILSGRTHPAACLLSGNAIPLYASDATPLIMAVLPSRNDTAKP